MAIISDSDSEDVGSNPTLVTFFREPIYWYESIKKIRFI